METQFIISLIGKIHDKTNRFLVSELKRHNIDGIAPSHGDIIGALCLMDQMTMKELSESINRDKSTVTALVNKLVELGYVEREPDATDNRVSRVKLTKKGESIKPDILEISEKLSQKVCRHLTNGERQMLFELLQKVYGSF